MEEPFSKKLPEYPWQLELPERIPDAKETEAERRADFAGYQFDFWKGLLDEDLGGHPPAVLGRGARLLPLLGRALRPLAGARKLAGPEGGGLLPRVGDVSAWSVPGVGRSYR